MNTLRLLGKLAGAYKQARDEKEKKAKDDEEKAWRDEQRAQERKSWALRDEEIERLKKEREIADRLRNGASEMTPGSEQLRGDIRSSAIPEMSSAMTAAGGLPPGIMPAFESMMNTGMAKTNMPDQPQFYEDWKSRLDRQQAEQDKQRSIDMNERKMTLTEKMTQSNIDKNNALMGRTDLLNKLSLGRYNAGSGGSSSRGRNSSGGTGSSSISGSPSGWIADVTPAAAKANQQEKGQNMMAGMQQLLGGDITGAARIGGNVAWPLAPRPEQSYYRMDKGGKVVPYGGQPMTQEQISNVPPEARDQLPMPAGTRMIAGMQNSQNIEKALQFLQNIAQKDTAAWGQYSPQDKINLLNNLPVFLTPQEKEIILKTLSPGGSGGSDFLERYKAITSQIGEVLDKAAQEKKARANSAAMSR